MGVGAQRGGWFGGRWGTASCCDGGVRALDRAMDGGPSLPTRPRGVGSDAERLARGPRRDLHSARRRPPPPARAGETLRREREPARSGPTGAGRTGHTRGARTRGRLTRVRTGPPGDGGGVEFWKTMRRAEWTGRGRFASLASAPTLALVLASLVLALSGDGRGWPLLRLGRCSERGVALELASLALVLWL